MVREMFQWKLLRRNIEEIGYITSWRAMSRTRAWSLTNITNFHSIALLSIIYDARQLRPDMLRFPRVFIMKFFLGGGGGRWVGSGTSHNKNINFHIEKPGKHNVPAARPLHEIKLEKGLLQVFLMLNILSIRGCSQLFDRGMFQFRISNCPRYIYISKSFRYSIFSLQRSTGQ